MGTFNLMSSPLLMGGVSSRRRTIAGSSKWLPDKSGSFTSTAGSPFLTFFSLPACESIEAVHGASVQLLAHADQGVQT
jgi:hypothetical protein